MDYQKISAAPPQANRLEISEKVATIIGEVDNEVTRAMAMWPSKKGNPYESYGILLEEADEFKAHVWMNQKKRDLDAMRKELVQVAAMAARFMIDAGGYKPAQAFEAIQRVAEADTIISTPMNSAHEGYIRLLEGLRQMERDLFMGSGMCNSDAIQVAAVAVRVIHDICDGGKGRV